MTTPTSYLQTLAKDEAIAFIASLQKVKTHLSHELAWMTQQVQQKTVQLQGIETLLSEATALGLVSVTADSTVTPTATPEEATVEATTVAAIAASIATNGGSLALPVTTAPANLGSASHDDVAPLEPASIASDPTPPPPAKTSKQGKRSLQPATKKSSAPVLSKSTSTSKASPPARESTQPFVRSQFQDQSITDAIGDILKRSQTPLSADEIMAVLYDGLSDEAYKRAKNSVTNILSVGRVKEKWKSPERGLYADNAVVA